MRLKNSICKILIYNACKKNEFSKMFEFKSYKVRELNFYQSKNDLIMYTHLKNEQDETIRIEIRGPRNEIMEKIGGNPCRLIHVRESVCSAGLKSKIELENIFFI